MNLNTKIIRNILALTYILLIVVLGAATWIEHLYGTDYVQESIYSSEWFLLLWLFLCVSGICWLIKSKIKRLSLWLLHCSFVIILLGALLTHLTSWTGMVHLREGENVNVCERLGSSHASTCYTIPFYLRLQHFDTQYHIGTNSVRDYSTDFIIIDGAYQKKVHVSMNQIAQYHNIRFYQHSYDSDGKGSYLSLNYDPWGIFVTYLGYICLFVSLLIGFFDPRGMYRKMLKNPLLKGVICFILFFILSIKVQSATVVPRDIANNFGKLCLQYSGRICPVQTFSIDFVKKISGKTSYKEYSSEQVLMSWIFYPETWNKEPILKVKSRELRDFLGIKTARASVSNFFNESGEYSLGRLLFEYQSGNQDRLHKAAFEMNDILQLIMSLRTGESLTLFPENCNGRIEWMTPVTDVRKGEIPQMDFLMIRNYFALMYGCLVKNDWGNVDRLISKLHSYQIKNGKNSLPSPLRIKAEFLYNKIPFSKILFLSNLVLGIFLLFLCIYKMTHGKSIHHFLIWKIITFLSFLLLSICLALRWIISGEIPLGNGYETMLVMAWVSLLLSLLFSHSLHILLPLGLILSGFFLLVSHISLMDPQITPRMPVLNSPLLTIHVSIIMIAYALLSFTFICGLIVIGLRFFVNVNKQNKQIQSLTLLSKLFLYPALVALAYGIFIGAIWANISWGQYWSWDPKETWALITFLVYAIPLHGKSFPVFKKPMVYYSFLIFAFLVLLMTYWGVNYLLTGMHSYA